LIRNIELKETNAFSQRSNTKHISHTVDLIEQQKEELEELERLEQEKKNKELENKRRIEKEVIKCFTIRLKIKGREKKKSQNVKMKNLNHYLKNRR
jgi:hypothetical protein